MLVITHQGIRVGKLYGSSEIVLPWEEMEAIFLAGSGIEPQLALRPKNVALFLSLQSTDALLSPSQFDERGPDRHRPIVS